MVSNTAFESTQSQMNGSQTVIYKISWKRRMRPYFILLPALLLTIGILYPFGIAIYYSLTNFSFKRATYEVVGIKNYTDMFTNADFWHGVSVTVQYALYSTISELVIGIGIALLLNRENRLAKILRMVLIFPLMIAPVIATLIWQLMTNPSVGIVAHYLRMIGLGDFKWGASPTSAMFSVVIIDIWVYTPFVIILVLAGLRSLPNAPFEAALLDGGSAWFTFKNLTLPMIMPFILIAMIFRLMTSLQEFDTIFALTNGGPGNTLMSLSLMAYNKGFLNMDFGSALTYMVFLWLVVYIISNYLVKYWMRAQRKASGF